MKVPVERFFEQKFKLVVMFEEFYHLFEVVRLDLMDFVLFLHQQLLFEVLDSVNPSMMQQSFMWRLMNFGFGQRNFKPQKLHV